MKAYCINLERRTDRKDHMVQQFLQAGLEATFVPAVDGANSAIAEEVADIPAGAYGRKIGAGAYACFQSHRLIWKYLVSGHDSHALIFEDDLIMAGNLSILLQEHWIPHDADLVKLETRLVRVQLGYKYSQSVGQRCLHRLHSSHFGTGCYVIGRTAAERLLKLTQRPADAIDELIFDDRSDVFKSLLIYQMIPAPTIQGDRVRNNEVGTSWENTSIESRFRDGFTPEEEEKSFYKKAKRRIRAEVNALLNGWSYSHVNFG